MGPSISNAAFLQIWHLVYWPWLLSNEDTLVQFLDLFKFCFELYFKTPGRARRLRHTKLSLSTENEALECYWSVTNSSMGSCSQDLPFRTGWPLVRVYLPNEMPKLFLLCYRNIALSLLSAYKSTPTLKYRFCFFVFFFYFEILITADALLTSSQTPFLRSQQTIIQ